MLPEPVIGIVGGRGAMGSWCARFFKQNGYQVLIHDKDTTITLAELAEKASVAVISVPIPVTCEVIKAVGPFLGADKLLVDITSLKAESVKAMLAYSEAEVIGLHPLFGPDVEDIKGHNVVFCPTRGDKWLPWLKDLFTRAGAEVIETTPERHDEIMALVQGLNHLNTILMGLAIEKIGIETKDLIAFSTPAFRTKLNLIRKISSQDPHLYAEIIAGNPHLPSLFERYIEHANHLKELLEGKNSPEIVRLIQKLSLVTAGEKG